MRGSVVNKSINLPIVAAILAIALSLVYVTIFPVKSFIKLVKFDILEESVGRFLFNSTSLGCNSSDNLSATSIISSVNFLNAAFSSINNAVPRPIARGNASPVAIVAAPSAALTAPIAIRSFVPVLIPFSIVSPSSKIGSQASPIFSSCDATVLISVRNNPAAMPSSSNIAVPRPIAMGNAYPVAVVATPSAAVTTPIATRITVPVIIAVLIVSPLSKTGCHAVPTSSSSLPIAHISPINSAVATPISNNIAVPIPRFTAIVFPCLPRVLVTTPTVTSKAVPTPIAVATVSAFSITGSQARPVFSNSTPSNQIAPTIRTAAAATSATATNPNPRFLVRSLSFVVILDVVVLTSPVIVVTVSIFLAAFLALFISFTLEKTPNAVSMPPMASIAPTARVALSTPLQSPA